MDFELKEEQKMIQETVRDFAKNEIIPKAAEYDKNEEFPREIIKKLGELGLIGMVIPEKYGGEGLDTVSYALAIEELSRADGSVGLIAAVQNSLVCGHIFLAGTERQKNEYLIPLARGKKLGAWALTEPNSGSDAAALETTANPDGQGNYILNGSKMFITCGNVADFCIVMAATDKSKKQHGISAFLIEKGTPGFSSQPIKEKLGLHACDTAQLFFDDVKIPKENVLGKLNHGFTDALKVLDGGRISVAAWAIGIARAAFEASIKYAQQRKQFGKTISEFQAIQIKLSDMATEIEAARLLTLRAAALKNQGKKITKESAMAKLFASEAGMRICSQAIQIHGGYGYTKDYPVERYFRDIKLAEIGEGTSEILRLVITKKLLEEYIL
jgi:hypothetical protein